MTPVDQIAARGFAQSAEAYELGRPGYPAAALEPLGLSSTIWWCWTSRRGPAS